MHLKSDYNQSKIMVGTAQWGMPYGAYNKFGKCTLTEIEKMLLCMHPNGITDLDTSALYGEAHKVLGKLKLGNFRVFTKIQVESSKIKRNWKYFRLNYDINSNQIYGLSIHNPNIIDEPHFPHVVDCMQHTKEKYGIEKIGISIYDVRQIEKLFKTWKPDIIQVPLNFFNNGFLNSGALEYIKSHGTKIHARSLFCQGLLLQDLESCGLKKQAWRTIMRDYITWCLEENLSQLEACLAFAKSVKLADKFVLGFDNSQQLTEVINLYKNLMPLSEIPEFSAPKELYDPRYWK